jgi:hypothetical protein
VTAEAAVASILGEAPVAAKPCERRSTNQRRGSTTLFAALNVLDGSVIGRNIGRHGHQEFTRFLKAVDLPHEPPVRERQGFGGMAVIGRQLRQSERWAIRRGSIDFLALRLRYVMPFFWS